MTPKEDVPTLRKLVALVAELNKFVAGLHEDGPYEVWLGVTRAKPGNPVVRYELRRKIGG